MEELEERHARQVAAWEAMLAEGHLPELHEDHFDWWAFPIDEKSSYGTRYTVSRKDVAALLARPGWIARFRRGVVLAAAAWGWDVERAAASSSGDSSSSRRAFPPVRAVRLYKMGASCLLFEQRDLFSGLRALAETLEARGESLSFHSSHTGRFEHVLRSWERRL